ncbi:unnamed protein product [Tuber melanosporum]|uniref:mRNA cap guanine-N(7) methyltransferase n=1 Tax=Tuber melanosporum (strain Mel28) TaxID=656061 RepID=D5GJM0_TUBMM|nr:uncharacterized protein GSTUM_00009071001 [Tuber melanosporum]CAZ84713.1 unnamed protein product [Tuber melanosporum]
MYDSARDCFTEQQQQEHREQQDRERQQQQEQTSPVGPAGADTPPRRRISTVGDLLSPIEDKNDALKGSASTETSPDKKESGSPEASSETMSPETPRKDTKNTGTSKTTIDTIAATATTTHSGAQMDSDIPASASATKENRVSSSSPGERRKRVSNERDDDASIPATSRAGDRRLTSDGSHGARRNVSPRRRSRSPPAQHQLYKRRPTSPSGRYKYRSPPPLIPRRDPSPTLLLGDDGSRSRDSSPPRKRKRPGQASRFSEKEKAETRERLRKMEEEIERKAKEVIKERGVEEVVKAHYNDKRELGKTWRKTDSRIKGLRSFNNWIKSTIVQKFSPNDDFDPRNHSRDPSSHLVVLDMGCGKGGDLLKWKSAPQEVGFYVGVDTADVSIDHARDRYDSMIKESRRKWASGRDRNGRQIFQAEFHVMDCWTRWIGEIPIVSKVGADPNVGPGQSTRMSARWGSGGGFDVVSMMFCMHYAFESEQKCRNMLRNVSGTLKKGGRFIGTIPSSDVISARVRGKHMPAGSSEKEKLDKSEHGLQEWGNSIYRVRFAEEPPKTGVFRPPWGWRYSFFLEEAVEEVPEYVVPWEAFRAIAEDYNLELIYKKPFHDIWREEKDDKDLRILSERMGVRDREGRFALGGEEWEACGFYLGFAFKKS